MSGHILHVHPAQTQTLSVPEQQYQLYLSIKENPQLQQQDIAIWIALQMKFENLQTSEYEAYVSGESSSGQVNEEERDDDEIPSKQVSHDIMEEVSLTIDETKKEILVSPHPRKTTPLVQSCQRDPEAPALSLINQDLLYLKKGSSGPEKIILSLHKKQKEPVKPKEEVYSNSKIIQVIKTYWELGHEYKFITEIVTRRANECIVSITEPNYKNLNKNDIEDMYLLIMNGKKVNLTAPTTSFPGVEKHKLFSIIYEPMHGIIYKNSKKEKMVMRHSEIHKFCDATLNRVLEGLKSYNNNVKYGYVQRELTNDEVEYLKLFEEEIEVRLKYRNQMRRWEMYVNRRPLGPRREHPK
ncbi:hypothetical protein Tco_1051628 [Tanacetum coccineum]